MSRKKLPTIIFGSVAATLTIVVALVFTGALSGGPSHDASNGGSSESLPSDAMELPTPRESAEAFLEGWVDDDGRVVRRDQGGDTVSEGQAYGLLISLGAGNEERFSAVWAWTEEHLMRSDGLLAWRWQEGKIVDDEPASDADLDAARALLEAGEVFGRSDLSEAGLRLSTNVLDLMTVDSSLGRILVPGLWAASGPDFSYNPSYASPGAFEVLQGHTGDPRWTELQEGSRAVSAALLEQSPLPPDWAQVDRDGRVHAMPGPVGDGPEVRYSYDAARLAIRHAESCSTEDRALAAQLHPALNRTDQLSAVLDLGGSPVNDDEHPLAYVARAAAAAASGLSEAARTDLRTAHQTATKYPTYYGAAWSTLGQLYLETASLGACPLLEEA